MVSQNDADRIYERIHELTQTVAALTAEVRESNALCKFCRPKVLGNGKEGFESRIIRLEENQIDEGESRLTALESTKNVSAWWITKIVAASAVVATIIATAFNFATKLLAGL